MATVNPFDLLDDDAEDPSLLIAAQQLKHVAPVVSAPAKKAQAQPTKPAAKLPSKPVPPSQAGNNQF
ncbi:hypothetical protein RDI58_019294 [Solanum bulbocastanum]|uniref:STM1-like N-terminal domain-containing protein n=1 Tax=Solanum bulbocastanum TaxID=147425 RepID=A0AAN8Y9I4_SOLBU